MGKTKKYVYLTNWAGVTWAASKSLGPLLIALEHMRWATPQEIEAWAAADIERYYVLSHMEYHKKLMMPVIFDDYED